jgi:hypothetical protein
MKDTVIWPWFLLLVIILIIGGTYLYLSSQPVAPVATPVEQTQTIQTTNNASTTVVTPLQKSHTRTSTTSTSTVNSY